MLHSNRIAFNLSGIMRRAHHEGRFARRMCRTAADRARHLSHWLKRTWADAKREAADLLRQAEQAAYVRQVLAARAAENVALAASYGSNPDMIRAAIASEGMRDRMNFAAVARLEAALAVTLGH
jgi:hypothetical protein